MFFARLKPVKLPDGRRIYPARHLVALPQESTAFQAAANHLYSSIISSGGSGDCLQQAVNSLFSEEHRDETNARTLAEICANLFARLAEKSDDAPNQPAGLLDVAERFRTRIQWKAGTLLLDEWEATSIAQTLTVAQVRSLRFASALFADLSALGLIRNNEAVLNYVDFTLKYASVTRTLEVLAILAGDLMSRTSTARPQHIEHGLLKERWARFRRDIVPLGLGSKANRETLTLFSKHVSKPGVLWSTYSPENANGVEGKAQVTGEKGGNEGFANRSGKAEDSGDTPPSPTDHPDDNAISGVMAGEAADDHGESIGIGEGEAGGTSNGSTQAVQPAKSSLNHGTSGTGEDGGEAEAGGADGAVVESPSAEHAVEANPKADDAAEANLRPKGVVEESSGVEDVSKGSAEEDKVAERNAEAEAVSDRIRGATGESDDNPPEPPKVIIERMCRRLSAFTFPRHL